MKIKIKRWAEDEGYEIDTSVKKIDQYRFMEMLEILPPMHWCRGSGIESFKMCEMLVHDETGLPWTSIFVRISNQYYEFVGPANMKFSEIMNKVKEKS